MRATMFSVISASVVAAGALGAGAASAEPAPLSAGELTAKLSRVIDTNAPAEERAAELEGGAAAVPTANNIASRMNQYDALFDWTVRNASAAGDRLDAELAVTVPLFGTRTHPIYWVPVDGAWKLSNASACVIARDAVGADCTV